MPTDTKLESFVVILTETVGSGPDAVTRKVEMRGADAAKLAAQIRTNLLPAPAEEAAPVRSSLDIFQPMAGMTSREANEVWRLNNVYQRDNPPPPSPTCTPTRKGLLTRLSEILNSPY